MSSTDLEQDPTPKDIAQRELEEKERKAKEDAEQAQLPYKWTQTIRDVDVTIPVPANIKGRDLDVVLTKTKIKVAIKGQEALIEVSTALVLLGPDGRKIKCEGKRTNMTGAGRLSASYYRG